MDKNARIYVAGHRGLVGQGIIKKLNSMGYKNIIYKTHAELDLTDAKQTNEFFQRYYPEYVFLAAAKVGGIVANNKYRVDFMRDNSLIQLNVLQASCEHNVNRLLFLGSSCIYPRDCPQPIKEEYFLSGKLEVTNRPYALAKISGIELCDAYNKQFNQQFLAVMPTNLYGPGDNYHFQNSHVIPALIRKMHEAKANDSKEVEIWGSGNPRREFLYSEDLAKACIMIMNLNNDTYNSLLKNDPPIINIGCGSDVTIKELVKTVAKVVDFNGCFNFNSDYPDGTMRKVLDVGKISSLGWSAEHSLEEGLQKAYSDFMQIMNIGSKELA
jgi:GDP-L-fucose synthase